MNLIFCGTPEFAIPALEKLLSEGYSIELVVTQPDEPSGRGYEVHAPPAKQAAERAGLRVFQPAKLKDLATREFLSKFRPDAIVVVAYGRIIPPSLIELPRLGCINLHASLLPKYRGAAPIQWAIIHGERKTGVTTMLIDPGMDTGDILLQQELEIRDSDTTETLSERLSMVGADLMLETLRGLERGNIRPQPQDHSQATMAPMLKKEHGHIDWTLTAQDIARRVRGLRPWPGAYTRLRGKNLHLWVAAAVAGSATPSAETGLLLTEGGKLLIVCGQGTLLEAKELQLEGRKRLSARDFLNGVRLATGEKVGS